jgi:hypothetical protein
VIEKAIADMEVKYKVSGRCGCRVGGHAIVAAALAQPSVPLRRLTRDLVTRPPADPDCDHCGPRGRLV